MESIKYDKLIRDLIPGIIEKDGKKCNVETMDSDLFKTKLVEKMSEELNEFICEFNDNNPVDAIKELADLIEVIEAYLKEVGITKGNFEKVRKHKRDKKGGFGLKLLLKEVFE